jgi:hypothetical protein
LRVIDADGGIGAHVPGTLPVVDADRFARAAAAIDRANGDDPNPLSVGGVTRPRALAEGELVASWIDRLAPDASDALRLAARAHHLRRWVSPRSSYPEGRAGYLRWRRDLYEFHATEVGVLLTAEGYEPAFVARVQDLVRKRGLKGGTDAEVQLLEDAICLAFLEAEFADLADRLDEARMIDVLVKTLAKMSDAGKQAGLGIDLAERERDLLLRAVAASSD